MTILDVRHVEDCFDGSFIKEIVFDNEVGKPFIDHLSCAGDSEYYPFSRPFFRVDVSGSFIVKGVQGNDSLRIILHRDDPDGAMERFRLLVSEFAANNRTA
jgi:hypothetical protein